MTYIYICRWFIILLPHALQYQIHFRLLSTHFLTCQTWYVLPSWKIGKGKQKTRKKYTVKHYTAMFFYGLASGHLISSALKVISFKHGSLSSGPGCIFGYGALLSRINRCYIFSLVPLLIPFVLIFLNPQMHTWQCLFCKNFQNLGYSCVWQKERNALGLKNEDGLGVLFNLCYYFTDVWLCIKIYLQVGLVLTHLKEIKGDVILLNIHLAAYNVILLWL